MAEYRSMAPKADLTKAMERSAEKIEETSARTSNKVAETMRSMADSIKNIDINAYKDRALDAVDDARAEVDKNVEHVKTGIRDHPFESVAIAAGAGLLFGAAIALMGRHAAKKAVKKA